MNKSNKQKIYSKRILWIFLPITVYILSLFTPGISAYSKYPIYLIGCRQKPISAKGGKTDSYYLPNFKGYRVDLFITDYFCTESQAKANGFRHANTQKQYIERNQE